MPYPSHGDAIVALPASDRSECRPSMATSEGQPQKVLTVCLRSRRRRRARRRHAAATSRQKRKLASLRES